MIQDARSTRSAGEITRKEMKGPDRFQVAATEAVEWATGRRKPLLLGVAALIVVGLVAVGVNAWLDSSRETAGTELYRVLEATEGEIAAVQLPGIQRHSYASVADRAGAVVAAAEVARRSHPGSRAAATAALASGGARLDLREWDAALADFRAYLAETPAADSLRFAALDGVARALEGKGDLAAAAEAWQKAGREVAFFADRAALERARVLARAGQVDEARKALQAFPEEHKDSLLKGAAQEQLLRLGGR